MAEWMQFYVWNGEGAEDAPVKQRSSNGGVQAELRVGEIG